VSRHTAHLVTGARYVEQITALDTDRRARAAFLSLVTRLASPGAAVFDFGAGPGLDARFYAEHGYRVAAYDVDREMCEFFAEHCRDLIQAGRITLSCASYRDFLAREAPPGHDIDLVTSNFAPLNLIEDLGPLFAKFHTLTSPGGKVLASVLNPFFLGDMKYRWWWRNLPRLWIDGRYSLQGAQAPIVRRRLADYAAQSAPYFSLQRVFPGLFAQPRGDIGGIDLSNGVPRRAALRLSPYQFMFLLFERRSDAPAHHSGSSNRPRALLQ
jgi:SAM-dependent methyltransferase